MSPSTKSLKIRGIRRRSSRLATIKRTADNIVIFKVFIEYFEEKLAKRTIIDKLSSYGQIKDFNIIKQNRKTTSKITFYDAMSASNLLRDSYIKLNNTHFTVKPCPTWEQPFQVTSYKENGVATAIVNQQQEPVNILSLNDYCLATIFEYLDLNSQLRFSLCHERLEDIFINMICKRTIPQQLRIDELRCGKFFDWEIWQFFKTAGQYIKGVEVISTKCILGSTSSSQIDINEMINEFCTNVQRLQVINRRYSLKNFLNMYLLTEIELFSCCVLDEDLEKLPNCINLTSLGLANNFVLVGTALPSLNKLQRLSVYSCNKMETTNLIAACKNLNLKYLDISSIYGQSLHIETLQHCADLEILKVNLFCEKDCEQIMELKKLKSLELVHCYNASTSNFTTLFDTCCNNLEVLKIHSYRNILIPISIGKFSALRTLWLCIDDYTTMRRTLKSIKFLKELEELYIDSAFRLRERHLLPVVKNCIKLKRFCIHYCKRLDENFIQSCYDILAERENNTPTISAKSENSALTIFVGETSISSYYIKYFNSSPKSKLLQIKKFNKPPLGGLLNNDLPFDVPYQSPCDPPATEYSDYSEDDDDYDDYGNYYMSSNGDSDDDDVGNRYRNFLYLM